nr:MAG TPA_asm: hypothetical protein [Caudoviricetes sp.]
MTSADCILLLCQPNLDLQLLTPYHEYPVDIAHIFQVSIRTCVVVLHIY